MARKLSPAQRRLLQRLWGSGLNLSVGTALLRTARSLERRELVCLVKNQDIGGFDVFLTLRGRDDHGE